MPAPAPSRAVDAPMPTLNATLAAFTPTEPVGLEGTEAFGSEGGLAGPGSPGALGVLMPTEPSEG